MSGGKFSLEGKFPSCLAPSSVTVLPTRQQLQFIRPKYDIDHTLSSLTQTQTLTLTSQQCSGFFKLQSLTQMPFKKLWA